MSDRPSVPDSGANEPTDRRDAPLYLARHRARQHAAGQLSRPSPAEQSALVARNGLAPTSAAPGAPDQVSDSPDSVSDSPDSVSHSPDSVSAGEGGPIYLRRFRARAEASDATRPPLWQRADLSIQQALTEDNRNKEISPPPASARRLLNDVYLIRHGETQGYSTDSGLTPQGAWQAYSYGRTLARRVKNGETVVFRHADTNRARETAEQIRRGLGEGLDQFEKTIRVVEPAVANEFRNFQFVAPDGLKDVTAAFREYQSLLEGLERLAERDRPQWLVEMDRFWRTQQGGGDPIQHWLTIPLLHFEPPSMCVRRFWAGISRLADEFPGARLAIASHSGCIRAFAVSALGYDPGEPYNTEHVRVKLLARGDGRDAFVAYRNRVQETNVPDIAQLPTWQVDDDWAGFAEPASQSRVR